MVASQIEKRIAQIEATPRALIGSDSGTHAGPQRYDLYEEISGERYAVYTFGGNNGDLRTIEEAMAETKGRIRQFETAKEDIRELRVELKNLRKELQLAAA